SFDLLTHLLHRRGVFLEGLDLAEGTPTRLFLSERMHRAQSRDLDDKLLTLGTCAEQLEKSRRIRVRCGLEQSIRSVYDGHPFRRIDNVNGFAGLTQL